jgi:transcriptional regulator with XRE-family HTH domain
VADRWRIGRGLSQVELERHVSGGEFQARISDLERGGLRGLSLETLESFARALDVTPADLVRLPRQPALVLVESG